MCTNKSPKSLSAFSPAPAFKSLLLSHPSQTPLSSGSSLCLQLFQLISEHFNVSSYYDASIYYSNMEKNMHERRKRTKIINTFSQLFALRLSKRFMTEQYNSRIIKKPFFWNVFRSLCFWHTAKIKVSTKVTKDSIFIFTPVISPLLS